MKKIVISLLICVAAIAVAGYLYFSGGSSANENLVPSNATGVAVFDPVKAVEEMELDLPLGDLSQKTGIKTGINFIRPIYAFITETGYVGLAAVLTDGDDLESNLQEVRSRHGLTWGVKDGFLICHDGRRALAFGPSLSWNDKNAQREMEKLMHQETSESHLLKELHDVDAPIVAKLSMKAVPAGIRMDIDEKLTEYSLTNDSVDIDSLILTLKANATNNSLVLAASLSSSNQKTAAMIEKYKKNLTPVSHHLDVHIPKNYSMWMTTSVDGAAICESLNKNQYMVSQMEMLNSFVNVRDILNVFHGDLLLVAGETRDKEIALVAEVNNNDIVNSPLSKILKWFDIKMGAYKKESSSPIYVTNSDRLKKEMDNGGYEIEQEDGYDGSCVFFMTMNPSKVMNSAEAYVPETEKIQTAMNFIREDVRKINVRATQDVLEFKMILSSTFNDYVSK